MGKTSVYLTVDVECGRHSDDWKEPIYGKVNGRRKLYGLDFILDVLKNYALVATFFVEPLFSYKFGVKVLSEICEKILLHGHEIQLHMHPFFKSKKDYVVEDDLYVHDFNTQASLVNEAKSILLKCGVPNICAFRAGSFAADNSTYKALQSCDITISSSYNSCYLNKKCRISLPEDINDGVLLGNDIIEMPVTCFWRSIAPGVKWQLKHLQISAVSYPEMRFILTDASNLEIKNIVIFFHTFEFINFNDGVVPATKINGINVKRFMKLCKFLSENNSVFEVKKISKVDRKTLQTLHHNERSLNTSPNFGVNPTMPFRHSMVGIAEQLRKRLGLL